MPKNNQEEYEVLKGLDDKWKWIARNYNGALIIYTSKPMENPNLYWDGFGKRMDDRLFQFIQWEDEEPHNVAELIEEYESEETEVKDLGWLKRSIDKRIKTIESDDITFVGSEYYDEGYIDGMRDVLYRIDQLDEPEVLSQEWIDNHTDKFVSNGDLRFVSTKDLQNLLVPKQEELTDEQIARKVDRAYKDGYEKGKEHATEKQSEETETVARVLVDYLIASAKLKLALSMEVEELEE